ncbi:HU family DNA-binding protein [Ureaplasma parvum]|uniref:HU family DNA-binding protein n=1 Tax=Ureaplasma parvum TaxID=134821 RepID=UPI0026F338EB|nr:HU family DNA-binding protein [Ureaplasma parvum]
MNAKIKAKTRAQMIDELSKMLNIEKKQTKAFMDTYEAFLILELSRAKEIRLGNIGKFKVSVRAERKGINPKTGETVIIPEKTIPKFTFTKGIKEIINAGISIDNERVLIDDNDFNDDEFAEEYIVSENN